MIELTGFQRDLLYALAGLERPSGIEVRDALGDYYGSDVIAARVYQNLDRLVDRGFVAKSDADARTNVYQITDAGRQSIVSRRAWEDDALGIDGELGTA
jgi:DNA-binding PadR family transcriptional regulator